MTPMLFSDAFQFARRQLSDLCRATPAAVIYELMRADNTSRARSAVGGRHGERRTTENDRPRPN